LYVLFIYDVMKRLVLFSFYDDKYKYSEVLSKCGINEKLV